MNKTPWGESITEKAVAPGITRVSTQSHGGLILSHDRWAALEAALGGPVQSFAGRPYLEEDVDAALAVLVWPGLFSLMEVWEAVRMFSGTAPSTYQPMLAGRRYVARANTLAVAKARTFEQRHAQDWIVGGMSFLAPDRGWTLTLRRIGAMEEPGITVRISEYPTEIPIPGAEVAKMTRV